MADTGKKVPFLRLFFTPEFHPRNHPPLSRETKVQETLTELREKEQATSEELGEKEHEIQEDLNENEPETQELNQKEQDSQTP